MEFRFAIGGGFTGCLARLEIDGTFPLKLLKDSQAESCGKPLILCIYILVQFWRLRGQGRPPFLYMWCTLHIYLSRPGG
jgi:hypothetical protein